MKKKTTTKKTDLPIFPKVSVNPETKTITWYVRPNSPGETFSRAFLAKTKRKEMTAQARADIVKQLCNSKDWTPWVGFIAAFAAERDLQFFKMLGSGLHEGTAQGLGGRTPMFSKSKAYLCKHWHDGPEYPHKCVKLPGLKWWRNEAVRSWISAQFFPDKDGGLDLSAYCSMRDRLNLQPEKKKKVRKVQILGNARAGLQVKVS
jgi:hypothetical protein